MRALWRGISYPNITWAGPVPVDVGGFLQVLGQSAINPPEKFWDKTYAIVAANYVNYACRLGYHFQSVDSYVGDVPANNYINFTFKGGAADDTRRSPPHPAHCHGAGAFGFRHGDFRRCDPGPLPPAVRTRRWRNAWISWAA